MKRYILGVAAALCLAAGPAAADGLPTQSRIKAPDAVTGVTWNGFYIGVGLGAGALVGDATYEYSDLAREIAVFGSEEIGAEGIFGTVSLGFDRVIHPGWVAGAFVDYDFGSSISSNLIDHNFSVSAGLRLGFLANAKTLIFGTAGWTRADFDIGQLSLTRDGYFVGAGIETFLRDSWTLKLEYRYADFGSEEIFKYGPDLDLSLHTARLVLSYRFDHRD